MKKIIFLDIDGVLNTSYSRQKNVSVDEFRLSYLAEIVKGTNAKIVLTSTWRYNLKRTFFGFKAFSNSTKTLLNLLKKHDLKINDTLPDTPNDQRALDIANYVKNNKITNFLILDDEVFDYNSYNLSSHLLQTYFNRGSEEESGLTKRMIKRACQIIEIEQ